MVNGKGKGSVLEYGTWEKTCQLREITKGKLEFKKDKGKKSGKGGKRKKKDEKGKDSKEKGKIRKT